MDPSVPQVMDCLIDERNCPVTGINANSDSNAYSMSSTSDSTLYCENRMTIYPAIDKKFDLGKSNYNGILCTFTNYFRFNL